MYGKIGEKGVELTKKLLWVFFWSVGVVKKFGASDAPKNVVSKTHLNAPGVVFNFC